jgi:hypothetical protein
VDPFREFGREKWRPARNEELIQYSTNRRLGLVEPDGTPPRLSPYPLSPHDIFQTLKGISETGVRGCLSDEDPPRLLPYDQSQVAAHEASR